LVCEILPDELNNFGDVSLCSCSFDLVNGTAEGDEDLTVHFKDGISVM